MFAFAPDRNRDVEPFTSFDLVRGDDFGRMFPIEGFAQFLELGRELLCLSAP
jgi:hypothetical protein